MLDEITNKISESRLIRFEKFDTYNIEQTIYNYIIRREVLIIQANQWNLMQVTGFEIYLEVMNLLKQHISCFLGNDHSKAILGELNECMNKTINLGMVLMSHPIIYDHNYL